MDFISSVTLSIKLIVYHLDLTRMKMCACVGKCYCYLDSMERDNPDNLPTGNPEE